MSDYSVIFPGQGSQNKDMLDLYRDNNPFNQTIDMASEILGYNIRQVVLDDRLNDTLYTQPILLAVSVGIWRAWQDKFKVTPAVAAGHSLGEYSAIVASGVLSFEDCIKLVQKRASLMVEACKGRKTLMAAVIGLDKEKIITICQQLTKPDHVVEAVNFNSAQQTVIGGDYLAVEESITLLKSAGAKLVKKLDVSVASHTSIMEKCSNDLYKYMINMNFSNPNFELIHNYDASSKSEINDIIQALSKQLFSPVKWVDSINMISNMGINKYIEIGPGKVLTGLVKRINKNATINSLSEETDIADTIKTVS